MSRLSGDRDSTFTVEAQSTRPMPHNSSPWSPGRTVANGPLTFQRARARVTPLYRVSCVSITERKRRRSTYDRAGYVDEQRGAISGVKQPEYRKSSTWRGRWCHLRMDGTVATRMKKKSEDEGKEQEGASPPLIGICCGDARTRLLPAIRRRTRNGVETDLNTLGPPEFCLQIGSAQTSQQMRCEKTPKRYCNAYKPGPDPTSNGLHPSLRVESDDSSWARPSAIGSCHFNGPP
ncbi:hypothetical protein DFH06DRAFT_1132654 [Mycena polygramma]|nr:hypothetical protein DFH06DRAFT_1132654 [Mycena polygramma]